MDRKKRCGGQPSPLAPRIVEMALTGLAPADIAATIGCEIGLVDRHLTKARKRGCLVPRQKRGARIRAETKQIIALGVGGMPPNEIAAKLGRNLITVSGFLSAARSRGLSIPKQKTGPKGPRICQHIGDTPTF